MLKAIHDALKQNKTRIFAEWHIELNFTFLPEFERHVRAMRPGIRYSSFTILRPPEDLVASNMAYWQHTMPANLSLRLHPEWLLFDLPPQPLLARANDCRRFCRVRTSKGAVR